MIDFSVTIPINTNTSNSYEIPSSSGRAELAVVAIESPTTLTTNVGTIEISDDGTTWKGLLDIYSASITFPLVQSKITMVKPVDHCVVKRYMRLVTTNNVTAERVFKIYLREVE